MESNTGFIRTQLCIYAKHAHSLSTTRKVGAKERNAQSEFDMAKSERLYFSLNPVLACISDAQQYWHQTSMTDCCWRDLKWPPCLGLLHHHEASSRSQLCSKSLVTGSPSRRTLQKGGKGTCPSVVSMTTLLACLHMAKNILRRTSAVS